MKLKDLEIFNKAIDETRGKLKKALPAELKWCLVAIIFVTIILNIN